MKETGTASEKAELRKEIRNLLSQKESSELKEKSLLICRSFETEPLKEIFNKAENIFLYMPLKKEADLTPLITAALEKGKKCFLPRVSSGSDSSMDFYLLDGKLSLESQTETGAFGIREPLASLKKAGNVRNALMILPGLAFGRDFSRLGKGKGFYDRYLEKFCGSSVIKAGVCFDFQLRPSVPHDRQDIMMDLIITEREILTR